MGPRLNMCGSVVLNVWFSSSLVCWLIWFDMNLAEKERKNRQTDKQRLIYRHTTQEAPTSSRLWGCSHAIIAQYLHEQDIFWGWRSPKVLAGITATLRGIRGHLMSPYESWRSQGSPPFPASIFVSFGRSLESFVFPWRVKHENKDSRDLGKTEFGNRA